MFRFVSLTFNPYKCNDANLLRAVQCKQLLAHSEVEDSNYETAVAWGYNSIFCSSSKLALTPVQDM